MSQSSSEKEVSMSTSLPLNSIKRDALCGLPHGVLKELPGQPNIVYELRKYEAKKNGASTARKELPFLFKPFEMGQAPPKQQKGNKKSTKKKHQPDEEQEELKSNESTIHEFLDWTVTAVKPELSESEKEEIIVQVINKCKFKN